jgi:hypothetical protein
MTDKQIFQAPLEKEKNSEATGIYIPFDVEQVYGAKRVPVCGTINGAPFRTTIARMHGRYLMVVNKQLREAANVKGGDIVTIEMQRDNEPRIITPPADLLDALNSNDEAKEIWEHLSFTHKKEFVAVIEEAKKPETRARRISKTIEELISKYKKA